MAKRGDFSFEGVGLDETDGDVALEAMRHKQAKHDRANRGGVGNGSVALTALTHKLAQASKDF
jgi:hypothetical protein